MIRSSARQPWQADPLPAKPEGTVYVKSYTTLRDTIRWSGASAIRTSTQRRVIRRESGGRGNMADIKVKGKNGFRKASRC